MSDVSVGLQQTKNVEPVGPIQHFIDKFFRISITIETVVILHCKD